MAAEQLQVGNAAAQHPNAMGHEVDSSVYTSAVFGRSHYAAGCPRARSYYEEMRAAAPPLAQPLGKKQQQQQQLTTPRKKLGFGKIPTGHGSGLGGRVGVGRVRG